MFKLICASCKQEAEPNEDFVSTCCFETFETEFGTFVTPEMIFEYLDSLGEYYEEEGLKRR